MVGRSRQTRRSASGDAGCGYTHHSAAVGRPCRVPPPDGAAVAIGRQVVEQVEDATRVPIVAHDGGWSPGVAADIELEGHARRAAATSAVDAKRMPSARPWPLILAVVTFAVDMVAVTLRLPPGQGSRPRGWLGQQQADPCQFVDIPDGCRVASCLRDLRPVRPAAAHPCHSGVPAPLQRALDVGAPRVADHLRRQDRHLAQLLRLAPRLQPRDDPDRSDADPPAESGAQHPGRHQPGDPDRRHQRRGASARSDASAAAVDGLSRLRVR